MLRTISKCVQIETSFPVLLFPRIVTGICSERIVRKLLGQAATELYRLKESALSLCEIQLLILAFGDEDEDRCRLGVGGAARVIARVGLHRLANHQSALSWSWIGLYGHAAACGVVVYHPVIVIPEHVLRRRWALEQIEEEWSQVDKHEI